MAATSIGPAASVIPSPIVEMADAVQSVRNPAPSGAVVWASKDCSSVWDGRMAGIPVSPRKRLSALPR
ncbi:hypothetical protein [Kutzneria sp. CA-103260]|uniref:hypothetical protein n=1 Tax=Kutzneria sp. CA-103260 TaxID=2802641 RepID=UPI001BEE4A9C|nr:hypothetical protein [Kutzneria sp. CA-103260]QUQ64694.1 hypothetical protein JJ691_24150 [Kutzneria sp. CA-103260]